MKPIQQIFFTGFLMISLLACNKTDFLNKKPNTSIIIPTTLPELRSMLDNTNVFTNSPGLGEVSADNYYLSFTDWQALSALEHNTHTWEKDLYGASRQISDWTIPCQQVLYANIVLEQLAKISPAPEDFTEWKDIKGAALFARAFAFCSLVQHFAPAYDNNSASSDLGIPLRLGTDIKTLNQRSTMQECYDRIFADLAEAAGLLSVSLPPIARNRPSKPAAYALLSRTYLLTAQYPKAILYADSCLNLYNTLIDYNTISTSAVTPFDRSNNENIYYSQASSIYSILFTSSNTVFADTLLYRSYSANDLRKSIFFRNISGTNMGYKRGYGGTVLVFTGLATDEVYLNRAESQARSGNTTAAINDLNTLLLKRWKTGTYTPITASSPQDALSKILSERRKELVWRGLRWLDLKRLNKEGASISLTRQLNGQMYQLAPNSPLYAFPFPEDEISLSGILQNPR